jgi:hypothetical protein
MLLAARNGEKYGVTKVIEIDMKSWDGDISKLSEVSVKGLLALLEAEVQRQEAEKAAREARQQVGILPAAVKEKFLKQITAESDDSQLDRRSPPAFAVGLCRLNGLFGDFSSPARGAPSRFISALPSRSLGGQLRMLLRRYCTGLLPLGPSE